MEEKYRLAGSIANAALKMALDIVEEGTPLIDIAEKIEGFIKSRGGKPAFPVNIAVNEVAAHYTPAPGDSLVVPSGSLVKVDLGVHVDGYIVDAAITVPLDSRHLPLARASFEALEEAVKAAKGGVGVNDVGAVVSRRISSHGFKPIRNLSGHKVERYDLHAGKSVPNVPSLENVAVRMLDGEVFAIEPFATDGAGYVVDNGWSHIYRVVSVKKVPREQDLNEALEVLWREFRGLPFAERWVVDKLITRDQLEQLVKLKRVYHYSRLVEQAKGMVSQFEDTVIVEKDRTKPLANTIEVAREALFKR